MPEPIEPAPNTAALFTLGVIIFFPQGAGSDGFKHHRNPHPAANALRGERVFCFLALEELRSLADEAAARGAERMAKRDRAAVDIELLLRNPEVSAAGFRLGRESLVHLDDVDVVNGQLGSGERLSRRFDRPKAHDTRRASRDG